jgi:DNA invertase Pin-like site-specific DNA recombinase
MLDTLPFGSRGLEGAIVRAALYARFSSDMQNPRSNADQLVLDRDHCSRNGWTVVAEFSDAAISGASMLNRPSLQDLMRRAEAGEFDVVVTESLDRLARNQASIATIFQELQFLGVRIVTLADGEVSEMHIGLKGTMAALFLRDLAQKVRRGHIGRVREGRAPAGRPPYGYRAVKGGEPGARIIYEPEAAIVRRIHEWYRAGVGANAIAAALNAEGVQGPGGGPWTRGAIIGARTRLSGILSNPIYAGRTVYNRRSQPKDPRTNRAVSRTNRPDQRAIGRNPELAIVDEEAFEVVQKLRTSRGFPHARHHRRPKHLLSGLLFCGMCGEKLTVKRRTKRGVPYFGCSSHDKGKGCSAERMVQGPEIEQRVLAGLRAKLLTPEAIELAVRTYREERKRLAAERARMRDSTERELGDVRRRIGKIVQDISEHGGSRALSRELRDLEVRERALETKLPTTEPDVVALHPQAAPSYARIVEDLAKALGKPEPARARAMGLLRRLITCVVVTPTPKGTPVDLEVTGDLLALLVAEGSVRQDAVSQAASIAITA